MVRGTGVVLVGMLAAAQAFVVPPSSIARLSLGRPSMAVRTGRRMEPCALLTAGRLGWRAMAGRTKAASSEASTALASAAGALDGGKKKLTAFEMYEKTSEFIVNLFPLWTIICSVVALKRPETFAWLTTNYFTGGLGLLMLSMGITLSPKDFADVLKRPSAVLLGFLACYGLMPALAMGMATSFNLSPDLAAGLVLVGSINGGQASNLCTYIAKGDVALSVMMTTATTLGAIFMTPLLCKFLLGTIVPVDAVGIAFSTIQVVLLPIVLGMTANKFAHKQVKAILPFSPVVGMICTCLLVAAAVGQCAQAILQAGWSLQIATVLYHLIGGIAGYGIPKLMGFSETDSRTMAIETAMKSSAFGFLLAKLHFGAFLARVPPAVSVVWMAVTGSTLAVIWRYIPVRDGSYKEKSD